MPVEAGEKIEVLHPPRSPPPRVELKNSLAIKLPDDKSPKKHRSTTIKLPEENATTTKEHPKSKKGRRKDLQRSDSTERRLQKVMKPLTSKCVPDKDHPPKTPSLASKRKALGLKTKAESSNVKRKNSDLVFVMPKVQDPSDIQKKKTVKMVHKLLKYMKKSWKVKVDPTQAERELMYRTINTVSTIKPDNWRELIEDREQTAVKTGFFCGFDGPYKSLINLELDTPLLVFNNLPPDLKITASRWLRDRALKEELKKKRDAYLPRLPRNKTKRPTFVRGRLLKDPGGTDAVDRFVQVAEGFQKLTKGSASYAKVLTDWAQRKEDENENSNSGFGIIRGGLKYGFKAGSTANEEREDDVILDKGENSSKSNVTPLADSRRESIIDGRKYQREMLDMEYKISALYDIFKSILNIKNKQLSSKLPLPKQVVLQLRDKSPENKERKNRMPLSLLKRAKRNPGVYTNLGTMALNSAFASPTQSDLGTSEEEMYDDDGCIEPSTGVFKFPKDIPNEAGGRTDAGGEDNLSLSTDRSSTRFEDLRLHSNKVKKETEKDMMNSELKIKRLLENPEHAAIRMARNAATYAKLFERHQKMKPPIWQSVHAENLSDDTTGNGINPKDPSRLTDADADEMVELAIRKRQMMQSGQRWPNESQILTPTFPFVKSTERIASDEQSRRNLLTKTGNIHEIPSTPVRRLYKLAGVRTTDKQVFNTLLAMKRSFRTTEKKVRVYYENEIGKIEWDTVKRFRSKLNAITPDPVFQWTVALMRQATKFAIEEEDEDGNVRITNEGGIKRQALWYRRLLEECSAIGAVRHNGCQMALGRLIKYCDVDLKTKSHMLSRLALLVVSLPTTELGSRHWQQAVLFLLDHLFGAPHDIMYQWLKYRGLPFLC